MVIASAMSMYLVYTMGKILLSSCFHSFTVPQITNCIHFSRCKKNNNNDNKR